MAGDTHPDKPISLAEALAAIEHAFAPATAVETIPLGVNCDDFVRSDTHRAHWRKALGLEEDAIAVLYVGRFSAHAKMNPIPMAMALERAALSRP